MHRSSQNGSILVHPTPFEAAVDVALSATNLQANSSFNKPEPMDLGLAKTDDEAELRTVDEHWKHSPISLAEAKCYFARALSYVRLDRLL